MRELDTPASDNYNQRFGGTRRLYGNSEVEILRAAHVCVIGIGGVGSWAVEALARTGIGEAAEDYHPRAGTRWGGLRCCD